MSLSLVFSALVFAVHFDPSTRQEAPPNGASASIRLDPRIEPFLDLWFTVRAFGSTSESPPELLEAPVRLAREIDQALGSPLAWAPIEGRLASSKSAADARAAFAGLPESLKTRSGAAIELRSRSLALVEALAEVETRYRETLWTAHETRIRAAFASVEKALVARAEDVFSHHAKALGIDVAKLSIPCALVSALPEPGAITHRDASGVGVCFVGVGDHRGSRLAEIILHEATHALDVAQESDAFDQLRARLERAGVARGERLWRDAPHTLMFAASASTIRAVIDAQHIDYGESSGYYAKVGRVAEVVRAAWKEVEAGRLARESALDSIVASLAPAAKKE